MVAAPTAGLPEQVGGERNWDYRYTWIRDASFSIYALLGLGYTDEATAFARGCATGSRTRGGRASPLDIMYRVDGSSDLVEETLDHLEGYRGSRPVRIGNGPPSSCSSTSTARPWTPLPRAPATGSCVARRAGRALAGSSTGSWTTGTSPTRAIWETRGGRKEFIYGRLMCWVAFDRAIRLADDSAVPARSTGGGRHATPSTAAIMDKGWNAKLDAFVQHYGSECWTPRCCSCRTWASSTPRIPVALDAGGDGRETRVRQPRLPLRPRGLTRRTARVGGHVLALHVLVRRCPGPRGPAGRCPLDLREDAHLREPRRACSPRRSASPASSSATSRRRSPTSRSSTPP